MKRAMLDLRSDTVTTPFKAMYEAMVASPVGDDVYGDDATAVLLERAAAAMTGKAAGLFVPTGTMGNLLAVLVHCRERGDEMIIGDRSHIALDETGGSAALGGVFPRIIRNQPDGTLDLADIRRSIQSADVHHSVTRLICLENTHNNCGGKPLSVAYTNSVGALAREHGLKLHIDGARLFNASAALQCSVKELVAAADSAMFCLSKGLAAPIGSVLVGSAEFVARARYFRKMMGGGMRQVGVVAGAALVGLREMPEKLSADHAVAKQLAARLAQNASIEIEEEPRSNMIYFAVKKSVAKGHEQIGRELHERGVRVCTDAVRWRLVTHYQIRPEDVETVAEAFDHVLNKS
jgi:threonine aldolase